MAIDSFFLANIDIKGILSLPQKEADHPSIPSEQDFLHENAKSYLLSVTK